MKRLLLAIPAALLLIGPGAMAASMGASPAGPAIGGSNGGPGIDYGQAHRKHRAILAVLEEGKKIQIADGGELTDTHRAELQHELDAARAGNY
jgi:hypothetical protein